MPPPFEPFTSYGVITCAISACRPQRAAPDRLPQAFPRFLACKSGKVSVPRFWRLPLRLSLLLLRLLESLRSTFSIWNARADSGCERLVAEQVAETLSGEKHFDASVWLDKHLSTG